MNNRLLTLGGAAAVLVCGVLSGCAGSAASHQAQETVTVTAAPPAPSTPTYEAPIEPTTSDNERFLDYVRTREPSFYAVSDMTLLDVGNKVCLSIASQISLDELVIVALDSGLTSDQTTALLAGAVINLCPEYLPEVQAQADAAW